MIRASPINSLDILIVDGGATSCGVALDVFIRGLHVDLVEHEDFSSVSVSLCSSSVGYVSLRSIRLHQSLFVFISWLPLICLSAIKASLCSLVSNPKPFQIWTVRSCPRFLLKFFFQNPFVCFTSIQFEHTSCSLPFMKHAAAKPSLRLDPTFFILY